MPLVPFLYPLKTLEKIWFLMFSGGIEMETSSIKWVKSETNKYNLYKVYQGSLNVNSTLSQIILSKYSFKQKLVSLNIPLT